MKNKKGIHYLIRAFKFKAMKNFIFTVFALFSVLIVASISLGFNIYIIAVGNKEINDIANLVVSAVSILISLTAAIINVVIAIRSYFKIPILEQEEYREKIMDSVSKEVSNSHRRSDYRWEDYKEETDEGEKIRKYLISDKINNALFDHSSDLRIIVNKNKQAMDVHQKEALYSIVSKKIAEGKSIFNSNLVRLRSDMLDNLFKPIDDKDADGNRKNGYQSFSNKLVQLEKTDYYAYITTNDQIYIKFFKHDYSSVYCGKDKTVDSNNMLYDLSLSPASNIIGVTTFAITSDGYLLLNLQGETNDVNNGCFVPSGSGSSDFDDLKKSAKIKGEDTRKYVDNKIIKIIKAYNHKSFENARKGYIKRLDESLKRWDNDSISCADEKLEYKNAEVAKLEIQNFKKYASKMKKYTYDFDKFLKYGMVRELIEESHLYERVYTQKKNGCRKYKKIKQETREKLIAQTYICGYIRILDKGGKPDFFGVTLLDLTSKEVKDMFKYGHDNYTRKELKNNCLITDFNEVDKQILVSIKEGIEKYTDVKEFLRAKLPNEYNAQKIKISLQTHCLFELLRKSNVKEKISNFLEKNKKVSDS